MRALIQRVTEARVSVGDQLVGEIGPGLCVLVGVTHEDGEDEAAKLAGKVANLRVFDDDDGVMNRSLLDTGGAALVVAGGGGGGGGGPDGPFYSGGGMYGVGAGGTGRTDGEGLGRGACGGHYAPRY